MERSMRSIMSRLRLTAGRVSAVILTAVVTAGITTTVVMVVAEISPQNAWQQPILRFVDTVVGVAVGVGVAWLALTLRSRVRTARPSPQPRL